MTKAELVEEVSRVSDLTKKHSEVIVDTVFSSIIDALHRGEKIELRGSAVSGSGSASRGRAATRRPATRWTCRRRRCRTSSRQGTEGTDQQGTGLAERDADERAARLAV
jgi:nucleoid DNA-binding protein